MPTEHVRRSDFSHLQPVTLEADGAKLSFVDYPAIAYGYAEAIVEGRDVACGLVIKACQRYLDMLEKAYQPGNDYYFSPAHVIDYCAFVENLRHIESGMWELVDAGKPVEERGKIILEPWQIWIEAAIHGFRRRRTGERLVSTALEVVPRKNAKTLKMVGAALYELVGSGQMGAQIPIAASSSRQSEETIFAALIKMVHREPDLAEKFKIHATQDYIACGDSKIWSLTAKGEKHDGLNPSLAIFEEGHAGATSVYKVIKSAFGARPNALIRMITTAGYRTEGPGYELLQEAKLILEGGHDDPTFFAAVYTLDLDDYIDQKTNAVLWDRLLTNEHLIFKANPMYGISLDPIKIATTVRGAMRKPAERAELARTRFDLWVGSGLSLIQQEQWDACRAKISLEDFVGQKCWLGVDLASTLDMCAITAIFEMPNGALAMFSKFFLPEESPTAQDEDIGDILHQWHEDGFLTLTPGPLADHDMVNAEIEDFCTVFDVVAIACDPKQAHNTVKYLWDGNRPVVLYANSADTMTGPTDDMIGKITAGMLMHDGNPVLAWNATNVHGERKPNGTILPRKDSPKSKRKIDGFVAGVMANGVRIMPQEAKPADGGKLKRSAYASQSSQIIGA